MSAQDEQDPATQRPRRRRTVMIAATGAIALLGATAYLTGHGSSEQDSGLPQPAVLAPAEPTTAATAASSAAPTGVASSASSAPAAEPAESETTARSHTGRAEAKTEHRKSGKAENAETDRPVRTTQEKVGTSDVSVVAADYDLTGLGQLRWAGDRGGNTGNALCTQKFKFDPAKAAETKSDMVMCWRTSSKKSVVALAFGQHGSHPSAELIAGVVDDHWSTKK
ncbi:hypothetical protein [Actinoplanes sp. L3-i22]|uniref:hypothetical protein n=1 Tax=Actinoplanes sp. L3-i22 TaxID=2836373 RepID=UPI001C764A09|nr:hypothetical protein [Actinoplanes sp. L3-i22]BCY13910.1 hypothetical protein L3i22_089980 [Actinoplanes sp. L3-i22]